MPAPITAARLARETEVSLRSLCRDIDCLRTAGARIAGERGYGYRLIEDYSLPPQTFDRVENGAIALGLAEVSHMGDPALAEAAISVLAKVAATLPNDREQHLLHAISKVYRPDARYAAPCDMAIIRDACWKDPLRRQSPCRQRSHDPAALRHVDRSHVTMLAWCCLCEDLRMFRTDRITELTTTVTRFRPRRVTLLRDHLAQLKGRNDRKGLRSAGRQNRNK